MEGAGVSDQPGGRPAGWKKDPTGRHYGRYWDGQAWTANVISAEKVQSLDPLPPRPEPSIFPETPSPPPRPRTVMPPETGPRPVPAAAPAGKGKNTVVSAIRGWPRWAQWALGVLVVMVVIGAAASGESDKDKTVSAGAPVTTAAATGESAPATTKASTTKVPATTPTTAGPKTTFGNGQYRVGTDIAPGTYVAPGGSGCYWERQATFGGSSLSDIIANDLSRGGQVVVTIAASDKGFKTNGCGTWAPG